MTDIRAFFDPQTATVTYLVSRSGHEGRGGHRPRARFRSEGRAADDGLDRHACWPKPQRRRLRIEWALDTHAHADHLSAADYVRRKTGAKIGIGARITQVQETFKPLFNAADVIPNGGVFDALFEDGATFRIGELEARVLHTPGHTPACVTYVIGDAAFVGDTLFMPDYGTARADFRAETQPRSTARSAAFSTCRFRRAFSSATIICLQGAMRRRGRPRSPRSALRTCMCAIA